jgi:imidazolonepropionase-like amidohydrolase
MKIKLLITLFWAAFLQQSIAQETFPLNDVQDKRSTPLVFKNVTLHVNHEQTVENAMVLVVNDKIEKVGKDFSVPKNAVVTDLQGKHMYPSFIDAYSTFGMPEVKRGRGGRGPTSVFTSPKTGAYAWNEAIKAEVHGVEIFKYEEKQAEMMRKAGFGMVVTHAGDGIVRGTGTAVLLSNQRENETIFKEKVANYFSSDKGSSTQTYPVSLMGSVALLRQTYYDAQWYKNGGSKSEKNITLENFNANASLPQVYVAGNVLDVLRGSKIGKEFGVNYIIKTEGDEYQKLNELKRLGSKFIVPLNFPTAYDVEDPFDAKNVTLKELKHWEMAPANLAFLQKEGIEFCITADGLKKPEDFLKNLRKAVQHGLDEKMALKALTTNPASFMQLSEVGSLEMGRKANFFITSSSIFDEKAIVYQHWVNGKSFEINSLQQKSVAGKYTLKVGDTMYQLLVKGDVSSPTYTVTKDDSVKIESKVQKTNDLISIQLKEKDGFARLSGYVIDNKCSGSGILSDATPVQWSAEYVGEVTEKAEKPKEVTKPEIGQVIYPFTAFGVAELKKQEDVIIKNATVWSNESEGIIEKADVIVRNGKIQEVGKNLATADLKVIDGEGKHLTTGIIDEHTHIALLSINEIQSVSSEVRQQDVIDPDDVDIYRQLAGGVTAAQCLHGSADCIGGQSALIKMKWGESGDNLLIPNADGFIKFALGENVKRGNSPTTPDRYPATRMGVEQVFQDAFQRAKEYEAAWKNYNSLKNKTGIIPPRKDLELDALVEILNEKRFITCHSYVQSEINMLMQLADSMGFKVNTFTHILEGYKVADKMNARGINASTFSDWWAYKMEVKEAIPYNAAILSKVGVTTAINSDDAEMARRLNQEAAKIVLYGGVSEEEAWKMVTLNPAKMLHLDNRMGSIKVGKDADLVLWTGNPLSVYARPTKTMVDGAVYFDEKENEARVIEVQKERNRIIQKMLSEKKSGADVKKPMPTVKPEIHCDTLLEFGGMSIEEFIQGGHYNEGNE